MSKRISGPAEAGQLMVEDRQGNFEIKFAGPILSPVPKRRQRVKAGFVRCACGEQAFDYCVRCGSPICTEHGNFIDGHTFCEEGCQTKNDPK